MKRSMRFLGAMLAFGTIACGIAAGGGRSETTSSGFSPAPLTPGTTTVEIAFLNHSPVLSALTEVDKLLAGADDYLKRLKELREQIEKRNQEKTIEQIHDNVFQLLQGVFGKKSESQLVLDFEKEFIKKSKTLKLTGQKVYSLTPQELFEVFEELKSSVVIYL